MDGHAAGKLFRHVAPFGRNAVKRETGGCDCMEPLRPPSHPKAGFVEAAYARPQEKRANPGGDGQEGLGAAPRPLRDARRREALYAEKIGEGLRRAVLRDQLLRMQIDRRRLETLAILRRPAHPFGKSRPRPAAAGGASVDKAPMLGDLDQPFRQVEHLTPLHADRHGRTQVRAAMTAGVGFVRHNPVGLGNLPQGLAFMALLTAARPARPFAKAHRLLSQPVARRGLRTRRAVQAKPAPKLRILSPQRFQLALKRRNQERYFRRKNHLSKESHSPRSHSQIPGQNKLSQ